MKVNFEALLEQMDVLAKATPAAEESLEDGKKIQAAAAEGDGTNSDDQTNADNNSGSAVAGEGAAAAGADEDDKKKEGDEKPLTKSFSLTLEDGSTLEAFDGTEMLKSLTARLEGAESELAAEKTKGADNQAQVLKSFQAAVGLISVQAESLKAQGVLLKSLTEKVGALSQEGRGARSVRSAADLSGGALAKSLTAASEMSNQEILAKSLVAHKAGRISGLDATRIETSLNMGVAVSAELLSAITSN